MQDNGGVHEGTRCEDLMSTFGVCVDTCTNDEMCNESVLGMISCKLAADKTGCHSGSIVGPKLREDDAVALTDVST